MSERPLLIFPDDIDGRRRTPTEIFSKPPLFDPQMVSLYWVVGDDRKYNGGFKYSLLGGHAGRLADFTHASEKGIFRSAFYVGEVKIGPRTLKKMTVEEAMRAIETNVRAWLAALTKPTGYEVGLSRLLDVFANVNAPQSAA